MNLLIPSISLVLLFVEAAFAYQNSLLTIDQIRTKFPNHRVYVPFIAHTGMWGDLFLMTPIVFFVSSQIDYNFASISWLVSLAAALAITIWTHVLYMKTKYPDSLAWGGEITSAGYVHAIYSFLVTALVLKYLISPILDLPEMKTFIAAVLLVHITISNRAVSSVLFSRVLKFDWHPSEHLNINQWISLIAFLTIFGGFYLIRVLQ